LLLALGLIYAIGYVTGAWILGRRVAGGASPILAFLAGWGILRLLALVPVLGSLAWIAASVVGLGALAVAGRRARRVVEPARPGEPVEPVEPAPARSTSLPPPPE
ncbi:MAG TPA: hypothetical protein VFZ79_02645, partial [Acidimicrobiales bacterium]